MYLISLMLPLISFIYISLIGRWLGNFGSFIFIIINMFLCLVYSSIFFFEVSIAGSFCVLKAFDWLFFNYFYISLGFLFDNLSICLFFLVSFVSLFVQLYSFTYMLTDPFLGRFISLLSFFTFAMLLLVFCDNLLLFFLGWEMVGISSYLLISFWYTRLQANKSALKAIFVNRIGDFFLMIALFVFFYVTYNFDFIFVSAFSIEIKQQIIFFLSLFFFVASIAKSAQVGLHIWLPDAMEGPTPVSALIHAATMVTAGVFLLLRIFFILTFNFHIFFSILLFFGSFTSLMSSSIALFQNDLKKVIAYSTCSQLGYMFFSLGLSLSSLTLFHLFNHGFFKALLFLGAGSIIHSFKDEQDIRKMGGVLFLTPFSLVLFFFSSLSLMGFPFLTGFFSKDLILIAFFYSFEYFFDFSLFFIFCILAALFTSYYSVRIIFFVFFRNYEGHSRFLLTFKEDSNLFYFVPFLFLFLGSVFFGFFFQDIFLGYGLDVWILNFPTVNFLNSFFDFLDFEVLQFVFFFKCLPLFFSFMGSYIFFCLFFLFSFIFRFNVFITIRYLICKFLVFSKFFQKKFLVDFIFLKIYSFFFIQSTKIFFLIDRGFLEMIMSYAVLYSFRKFSSIFNLLSTGIIFQYFFIIIYNILFIILCYFIFDFSPVFFFFVSLLLLIV